MQKKAFLFSLLFCLIPTDLVFALSATILATRHAEKLQTNPDSLSSQGKKRAQSLVALAENYNVTGIYTSPAGRALETGLPLAQAYDLPLNSQINPTNYRMLIESILAHHDGETVLLVGHSNTIPELINFLLPQQKLPWIEESDYSNLFLIRIGQSSIEVEHYRYEPSENDGRIQIDIEN